MKRVVVVSSAWLAFALGAACVKDGVAPAAAEAQVSPATNEPSTSAAPRGPSLTMSADPFVRPVPEGEAFRLARRESRRTKGGLEVTYAGHGHKHPAGPGRPTQMITLSFRKGDRTGDVELRGEDDVLEGEIDALGTLLVVRGAYAGVDVTVAADPTPAPLDEEQAWDLIDETAAKLQLAKDGGGGSVEDGVLRYGAVHEGRGVWSARLGLYTRRLWFLKPSE